MSTSIAELAAILQTLLIEDANRIGRESGFIQRQRKFSGASFAQALVFGWQANPQASLEELCQSAGMAGVSISPQGLQDRLDSSQAAKFMQQLLERAVSYVVSSDGERNDLLARFKGVYIQDSTIIELPLALRDLWAGCGNQASKKAGLKVQTMLNYQAGHLSLQLAEAKAHDCPLQSLELPKGSLHLADIGYFKVANFRDLSQRGVWWLSRLPARVGIWDGLKLQELSDFLAQQTSDIVDLPVELSAQRLACRLIAVRVPAHVAQKRQERARSEARQRPHNLQATTLDLCSWTIIVTNLSAQQLSVEEALILLRLRWQIELLFKLWKQILLVDEWRSQQVWQILTELYAKLLIALLQHWFCVISCWQEPRRSLVKASLWLRKQAFQLLTTLTQLPQLLDTLALIVQQLPRCLVQKRKARPATFQLLSLADSLT
jgi:hypothetical protein